MNMIKEVKEGRLGERPSFDEIFMAKAIINAMRSSCLKVHAGTVIVDFNDSLELGSGYNGAAPGLESCLKRGYCEKERATGKDYDHSHGTGNCRGTHAEMNARAHITRQSKTAFAVYTTIFPCNDCTNSLLAYKAFKKLVFKSEYTKKEGGAPLRKLEERGIQIVHLDLSPERFMDIAFNERPAKFTVWSPEQRVRAANYLERLSLEQPSQD